MELRYSSVYFLRMHKKLGGKEKCTEWKIWRNMFHKSRQRVKFHSLLYRLDRSQSFLSLKQKECHGREATIRQTSGINKKVPDRENFSDSACTVRCTYENPFPSSCILKPRSVAWQLLSKQEVRSPVPRPCACQAWQWQLYGTFVSGAITRNHPFLPPVPGSIWSVLF